MAKILVTERTITKGMRVLTNEIRKLKENYTFSRN